MPSWSGRYPLGCLAPSYVSVGGAEPEFYLVFDPASRTTDGLMQAIARCDKRHDEWLVAVQTGRAPWEVQPLPR